MQLVYPNGALAKGPWSLLIDDQLPGWHHTRLRVAEISTGEQLKLDAESLERILVPLHGSFSVSFRGEEESGQQELEGRSSVFDGPTDVLYLPTGTDAVISGQGAIAVAEATTEDSHPVQYLAAAKVPVELRGSGVATRQVHNFGTPLNLQASKLIVCEVITPSGNWSSYPPHKHDENVPGIESNLEEIYYFVSAVSRSNRLTETESERRQDPIGFIRNYGPTGVDTLAEVRTGDAVLVPSGWHGPCMAAPGYDLYYLNVMAGPDQERAWLIRDDPNHAWVRETWSGEPLDPRLPYLRQEAREGVAK